MSRWHLASLSPQFVLDAHKKTKTTAVLTKSERHKRGRRAPSNTGGMRPFVTLSLFFETILHHLLPGSTYYFSLLWFVFRRRQTAPEFECHRTQTTFIARQSPLGRHIPHRSRECAVSRMSRQTDPRGKRPPCLGTTPRIDSGLRGS